MKVDGCPSIVAGVAEIADVAADEVATVFAVLTREQLLQFARDGYVMLRNFIPEELLRDVDREFDEFIAGDPPPADKVGRHDYFVTPDRAPAADAALRDSGARDVAHELVAPRRLDRCLDNIQLGLNYPTMLHRPGGPHLDGHNPDEDDKPNSFTLLAGVFLCDESKLDCGNLYVWPGSHLVHAALFRDRGPDALLATRGHITLVDDPPRLSAPRAIHAQRGDLLLAHFLLGHNWSGNTSDQIRRIVYYRLTCDGHRERWAHTFIDPWAELAPIQRAIDAGADAEMPDTPCS